MHFDLMISIVLIAIVDSLNPSLFVAQFYLFTAAKPTARILSYIAGVLLVNFTGGLLIVMGLRVVIGDFISTINTSTLYGIQLIIGVGLIGFGVWYRAQKMTVNGVKQPRSLKPFFTFILGMVVMLNEITTALPYFIAIERVVGAGLTPVGNVLALLLYNFIFSLPLFGFLLLFLIYRQRFASQLERISDWVASWTPRILKYGTLTFGFVLAINASAYFITGMGIM